MKIKKLAIANRGEVAVRIIRACNELGIKTVLLHSEADTGSIAYRISDENMCIGPAAVAESYLSIERNIEAAITAGAHAIHPGFGFLSENADFARACRDNKIIFVGPSPESIEIMGDKISAKQMARSIGLQTIPGFEGDDSDFAELKRQADKIGYPIIVKAAGGGGGRGLKVARDDKELGDAVASAQREAQAAFGTSRIFLEKYFEDAKHIEVQIFADSPTHAVYLFERECSIQRRHQKIVEEAPSPTLKDELRAEMGELACKLAQEVKYLGAGTVEFLLSKGKYYFMEMNTRLQVEHPVTELITGIDLVKAQIQVAGGELIYLDQKKINLRGHAVECRLYAEDPYNQGRPSTGMLGAIHLPQGPGRRFDIGFEEGDEITSHYDPMIGKLIVWDETRARALQRMQGVLRETVIFGVRTNIPLLNAILSHFDFISGKFTTQFMNRYFAEGLSAQDPADWQKTLAAEVLKMGAGAGPIQSEAVADTPWSQGWRIG